MVTVEVASRLHMSKTDSLATFNGHSTLAYFIWFTTDTPVTVGIVCCIHTRYRLLPTSYGDTLQNI